MANANNPGSAGLRPPGKAECLPSEGASLPQQTRPNRGVADSSVSDSSEGRHSAFPGGRKPAKWRGAHARDEFVPPQERGDSSEGRHSAFPGGRKPAKRRGAHARDEFVPPHERGDSSEGRHSAFPSGRKPAKWHGARAGVAPSSPNHRTQLPHVEAGEVPQHVCFRLAGSLPREIRRQLIDRSGQGGAAPANAAWRRDVHAALDASHGVCWLRRPSIAALVRDAFLHFHEERYLLHEWVIMPNHVHVLLTPLVETPLSSIVHSWKSHTARRINAALGREGRVWASDYFDRMVRSDDHFTKVADYIRANPVNAGLCDAPETWRWSSAYEPSMRDAAPVWFVSRPPLQARAIRPRQPMRTLHAS